MSSARRLLQEPLVQFLLAGGLIFGLYTITRGGDGQAPVEPSSATVDRNIVIRPADLQVLRENFTRGARRAPTADELGDLVETFVNEEMLYREGKASALDHDDVVVRRRIIEKMTVLARPSAPSPEPTEAQLRGWWQRYPHRFRQAPRWSFQQRFFDPKRRTDAAADARRVLQGLRPTDLARVTAVPTQDAFVLPELMEERSDLQIAHLYGAGFVTALEAAPLSQWSGPHRSSFGEHLVFVSARAPGGAPPFEAVEKQVRADWLTVATRGLHDAARTLLPRYSVTLEGLDPQQTAALTSAPAVAPLLGQRP